MKNSKIELDGKNGILTRLLPKVVAAVSGINEEIFDSQMTETGLAYKVSFEGNEDFLRISFGDICLWESEENDEGLTIKVQARAQLEDFLNTMKAINFDKEMEDE